MNIAKLIFYDLISWEKILNYSRKTKFKVRGLQCKI